MTMKRVDAVTTAYFNQATTIVYDSLYLYSPVPTLTVIILKF